VWLEFVLSVEPTTPPATTSREAHPIPAEPPRPPARTTSRTPENLHIWLLRLRSLLFVTMCATLGVLLIILPWTPRWTDNPLLLTSPNLRDFVSSGFVRGFASGLGILDLWLGFWEAIHYHENPRP
jgi:hypothetical protein